MHRNYKKLLTGVVVTGPFLWSGGANASEASTPIASLDESASVLASFDDAVHEAASQSLDVDASDRPLATAAPASASRLMDEFETADSPELETLLPETNTLTKSQIALVNPLQPALENRPVVSPVEEPNREVAAIAAYQEISAASFANQNTTTTETLLPVGQVTSTSLYEAEIAQSTNDASPPLSDEEISDDEISDEEIRQQLLITPNAAEPAADLDVLDRRPQPIPSSSFITPNAYGADWGDVYFGAAGTTEDSGDDGLDASASLGAGFGNAVDSVGVELNVGIISIDGFADDGSVGIKVHKLFPRANNLGVAVGWTNAVKWGAAKRAEDTIYGVVTQRFDLRPNQENSMPLTASLGVGTGTFRSTGAIEAGDNAPNVFGSVGLRVVPRVSLVSSWSGSALGLAASAAPFRAPVVFTVGVSDLTDNTDAGTQFVGGLGYSLGF